MVKNVKELYGSGEYNVGPFSVKTYFKYTYSEVIKTFGLKDCHTQKCKVSKLWQSTKILGYLVKITFFKIFLIIYD